MVAQRNSLCTMSLLFLHGVPVSPWAWSRFPLTVASMLWCPSQKCKRDLYLLRPICTNIYAHIYLSFCTAFLCCWAVTDCRVAFDCTVHFCLFLSTASLHPTHPKWPFLSLQIFYDFESTWRHSVISKLQTIHLVKRCQFEDFFFLHILSMK